MKVEMINPFVESVDGLFETMLDTSLTRGEISATDTPSVAREITALIGLSGLVRGTVAMAFPSNTAIALVNRLLETDSRIIDDMVTDGISEFVNIVAGSAKAKFLVPEGADPIELSLPTVIRGENYSVTYPSGTIWLAVPFSSDLGDFHLRVTMEGDVESRT